MKLKSLTIIILLPFIYQCSSGESEGKRLYTVHCANCHMENGEGLKSLIPPLTHSAFLDKHRKQLPCWIKRGIKDPLTIDGITFSQEMPGVPYLSDAEIANIINYVFTNWGNKLDFYSDNEVSEALIVCE